MEMPQLLIAQHEWFSVCIYYIQPPQEQIPILSMSSLCPYWYESSSPCLVLASHRLAYLFLLLQSQHQQLLPFLCSPEQPLCIFKGFGCTHCLPNHAESTAIHRGKLLKQKI